ncbi:MAG: VWA domain-containing protein [Verrucomicrobiota bacterium]
MNGTDNIQFEIPALLWVALIAVPCLAVFFVWAWRRKQAAMALFIPARLFDTLLVGYSARREKVRYALLGLAVVFGLLALAQPRWGYTWEEVKQRGLDVVVAVDTSRSMLAPDVPPTRIERARLACIDLMRVAKTDRLGLVAFAGSAFLQCPLTFDDEAFRLSLSAVDTGIIPQGGSSLAEAIKTATEAFKKNEDNHKVLILLTDGEDHEEGAIEAAKEAAKAGLKIFTIGVGTPNGELLSFKNEQGKLEYVRDETGNIVRSRLNEELLREIATVANGFYLPLSGAKTMETLYEQGLAGLPKAESSAKFVQRFQERFQWPLAIVIVLLAIEWLLQGMPAPKQPQAVATPVSQRKAVMAAVTVLVIGLSVNTGNASPAQARRAFEAGEYKAALEEYQRLLRERPGDARLHYNAGSAAYRADDLDTAVNQFNEALRTTDLGLQRDAYYNRANTRYRQGEKTTEAADKQQMWESAINDYDRALKLNPEDADAKFNRELVQRKLEELKTQQEQQQQHQNPDDKNQDKKENPDDKQKQEQKKQENQDGKDQQKKQGEQDQKGDEQEKQKQQEQAKKKQDQGQKDSKQDKPEAEQQGKKGDEKDEGQKPEPGEDGQPMMAQGTGEMTQQQAMQLLDALKGQEKALIFQPPQDGKAKPRIFKDW